MKLIQITVIVLAGFLAACGGDSDSQPKSGTDKPAFNTGPSRCGAVDERPWCDTTLTDQQRAEQLVAVLTLEQKIDLLAGDDPSAAATGDPYVGIVNGFPELGIPPIRMSDGPMGVRGSPATAMPVPLALAASFNPELAFATGKAIGNEVRNKGNDLVHAPVGDLVRNPLAGRTFETFGEDPLLSSILSVEWIRGAQSEGVLGNIKHYLMNTQEGIVGVPPLTSAIGGRHLVNAVVDERTLREIYLPPYEAAVKEADVASLMCAYNYVNGDPACSSPFLLQQVLRDEWGFDGFLVTDYYLAQKDTVQTANVSPMIEMPFGVFFQPLFLQLAVQSGQVSEATIDSHITDIMRTLFRFGFFDRATFERNDESIDQAAHAAIARDTVEQGSVLLKNAGALPLPDGLTSIAVIGLSATERPTGGGSSFVTPFNFTTPLDAINQRAGPGVDVQYNEGREPAAAAALAASADVAIVFASNISTEGVDKFCLGLDCTVADVPDSLLLNTVDAGTPDLLDLLLDPVLTSSPVAPVLEQIFAPILLGGTPLPVSHRNQDALIAQVAAANPNTVVVLQVAGAVLTPWREQVNAILVPWYGGQAAGAGIARLLFGDADPGGRLPVSFPVAETDHPAAGDPSRYPGIANQAAHSEGIFIGYRWHDENAVAPAYPFGFGLSYSQFEVEQLSVSPGSAGGLQVTGRLVNTGQRAGWGVAQLYLGLPETDGVEQPPAALKDFAKHWLKPGQARAVSFTLDARALSYWNVEVGDWVVAPGCYRIMLGQSSRDLPLQVDVPLVGGSCS